MPRQPIYLMPKTVSSFNDMSFGYFHGRPIFMLACSRFAARHETRSVYTVHQLYQV